MIEPDVRLVSVKGVAYAEQMLAVHEATATHAYAHIFSGPFPSSDSFAKWTNHDGPVVIAIRHHNVVGFAAARGDSLVGLFVLPSEAGRGIGTALLDAIGPVTKLWVLDQNKPARAFYEGRGWQWSGLAEASPFADDVNKLFYVRPHQLSSR